jgi:hypothetical protein
MSLLGPLQEYWRLQAVNNTGQTLASLGITVKFQGGKYNSSGVLVLGSEGVVLTNGGTLANGAYLIGSTVDNRTDLFTGGTIEFTVTAPASSNGDVILYLQRSLDNIGWEDNGLGIAIASLNFTGAATKRKVRTI